MRSSIWRGKKYVRISGGIFCFRHVTEQPPLNTIQYDPVTTKIVVASVPETTLMFVALTNGRSIESGGRLCQCLFWEDLSGTDSFGRG